MPELKLIDVDPEATYNEFVADFEKRSGRTLSPSDPICLMFRTMAAMSSQIESKMNDMFSQNFISTGRDSYLDFYADELCVRLPASPALTTMQFTLTTELSFDCVIPMGTRCTAGGKYIFATDSEIVIPAGETTGTVTATCTTVGEFANGLVPGQIKTLVDPLPYVSAVANTTTSNSGAETESDESYRERIRIAPESLSVAGSEGAYRSRVLNAHQNIVDVAIINPSPGIVRIYPLMEGAELPSEEVKNTIMEACSDKTVRPLTDLVEVVDPEIVNYSISFTYYISETSESLQTVIASQIEDAVDEFITWQKSRLGYGINTSKLICMVVTAGASRVDLTASSYPSIGESQVAVATAQSIIYGGVEND